jgi:hypothetical protein
MASRLCQWHLNRPVGSTSSELRLSESLAQQSHGHVDVDVECGGGGRRTAQRIYRALGGGEHSQQGAGR